MRAAIGEHCPDADQDWLRAGQLLNETPEAAKRSSRHDFVGGSEAGGNDDRGFP